MRRSASNQRLPPSFLYPNAASFFRLFPHLVKNGKAVVARPVNNFHWPSASRAYLNQSARRSTMLITPLPPVLLRQSTDESSNQKRRTIHPGITPEDKEYPRKSPPTSRHPSYPITGRNGAKYPGRPLPTAFLRWTRPIGFFYSIDTIHLSFPNIPPSLPRPSALGPSSPQLSDSFTYL